MRRIRKRWAPTNVSPDGQKPYTMQKAEEEFLEKLPSAAKPTDFARDQFDSLDKKKLRERLMEEHKGICVYCQSTLNADDAARPLPVEHWRPLGKNPELALHWENLYLSCPEPDSCDGSKKGVPLETDAPGSELPWRTVASYHDWLGISKLGEVYVRSDANISLAIRSALEAAIGRPEKEEDDVATGILRLNNRTLRAARVAAIDQERTLLHREFGEETATRAHREAHAGEMLRRDVYPSYVSTRVAYLRRTLGKHKAG